MSEKQLEVNLRIISIKMDTGNSILEAKSDKGSKGCIFSAFSLPMLKHLQKHIDETIRFKERE